MKSKLLITLSLLSLLLAGCGGVANKVVEGVADVVPGSACSWEFIQSVGGMTFGTPARNARGHVSLPIHCNLAGEMVTVRPTAINSGIVCKGVTVRTTSDTVFLTIRQGAATARHGEATCPAADLGKLSAGRYFVVYQSSHSSWYPLGTIEVPK